VNAMKIFKRDYESQKKGPTVNHNASLLGITAHNLGVVCILAGRDGEAKPFFREAVDMKKAAFGEDHPEVAVSLDELGIQLFAAEKFGEALSVFNESRRILTKLDETHFRLCMLLNNISCCTFQMGNALAASGLMHDAWELQRERNARSSAKIDLDLLYLAILANNYGYLKAQLKDYEEARALFEEAMLVRRTFVYFFLHHFVALLITPLTPFSQLTTGQTVHISR
jgi:tetratricopeptide (TPR) repeat protein